MADFFDLTVTDIQKTVRDAVVLTLTPNDEKTFAFVQGQYLTFRREFDGEDLRRSYSICSGKSDGVLQVGVKRVDGGVFSTWANSELKIGDALQAMAPMGNFYSTDEGAGDPHYLAFAAGSGITPILSILRTALATEASSKFTLVYGNRNLNTVMFREELEDLKNLYMDRFTVIHILSGDVQDIDLFSGRVDGEKCKKLFAHWIDVESVTTAYICGPEAMMLAVSASLKDHGLNKDQIRFELFGSNQQGRAKRPADIAGSQTQEVAAKVVLGGDTSSFSMARNVSLLDAALQNDVEAPFACKAGVCSTCRAKVTSGEVEMIANHALEDYEVDAGYVLSCQCYPLSDNVSWDYDETGVE